MIGRFMNNYYYGKSGKGDYTPDDLPKTRWQLFLEMLRTRLSGLCRLNLLYVLPWLPTLVVLMMFWTNTTQMLNYPYQVEALLLEINAGTALEDGSVEVTQQDGSTAVYSAEDIAALRELDAIPEEQFNADAQQYVESQLLLTLLLLIPCIFITGPWTAGVAYVTRNWARDEHAFIWSDCKDAMKENWKASFVLSGITSVVPIIVYLCWTFYGEIPADSSVMTVLLTMGQMIPVMVGVIWYLAVTYAYPMLVTYKMSVLTVIRNSLILAVGRLPLSVGIRLLLVAPAAIGVACMFFFASTWALLIMLGYYVLFGFTFSRFITASYTNAQFDRFINNRIEGAKVNQGLAEEEDDDDFDDDEDEGEREIKPWENGYVNRDA